MAVQHQRDRAKKLAAKLRVIRYDGIFLDATTSASVHPAALAAYNARHPQTPYDVAFAHFLRGLRGEKLIVATNQGYRAAKHVLPFVDVDVSESLITRPVNGRFVFRPWYDPQDPWNSISFLMRRLIEPVQRQYPNVRFVHINYLDAPDARAAVEIVAIARLYDADAFVTSPSLTAAVDGPYFVDMGNATPRVETERTAYRVFERGFVAVNKSARPMRVRGVTIAPGSVVLQR